jgi:hypothetical protein
LDLETSRLLESAGFDRALFDSLVARYKAGELSAEQNYTM